MYAGLPERLARELETRRRMPRAVFLSPSGDPFPPFLKLQQETVRVVQVLANHNVKAWLMTRGFIRPAVLNALDAYRSHVRFTVGLTTMDRALQRALEPLTAPPRLRLRQIRDLKERGFPVQAALEPLIPGITDTRKNLTPVLDSLAALGVSHIATSYLFLRPGIRDNLLAALELHNIPDTVTEAFDAGLMLTAPGLSAAWYLPRARRQRGYATVMALAAERGMSVSISSLTNPDLPAARSMSAHTAARQRLLPMFGAAFPVN
jgi:DNA repair photolyase